MSDLAALYRRLGYVFEDEGLVVNALTHRSKAKKNNERLEFLGDSILSFIISRELYTRYPDASEGELSAIRANLVKGESLTMIARELELGSYLLLGQGEMRSGGHHRDSILADCFEALLAAVFLDADMPTCYQVVTTIYQDRLSDKNLLYNLKDPKTRLQELLQANKLALPRYELTEVSGEQHQQVFTIKCHIKALKQSASGKGNSRRKAEKEAASNMLTLISKDFYA